MHQKLNIIVSTMVLLVLAFSSTGSALGEAIKANSSVEVPDRPLPAAQDYATASFGNAWDMNEFSDVSQYLNGGGRYRSLADIQVQNGIFSARSLGDHRGNIAFFYPVFGGYDGFMQIGRNLGSLQPVDPQKYSCFYVAMRVESPDEKVPNGPQGDIFRIFWRKGSADNQTSGGTYVYLYPETLAPTNRPLTHNWKLYKVDLNDPLNGLYPSDKTPWSQGPWTNIEFNPTIFRDTRFEIDWIRLTDCENRPEHLAQIEWSPDRNINAIWVRPVGTQRNILVATNVNGNQGSYSLDTKGLAPGAYQVGLGTSTDCCSQWSDRSLRVNEPPVVEFQRPSPYSGEDYATAAGNAWDMDPGDVTQIRCSQARFENGILKFDTASPSNLPSGCRGAEGEAESQIFLNLPGTLMAAGQYRYLSFRHYINGEVPMPPDGMIGRWIWTATNDCTRVSADIPFDVGWHTYTIDLYDAFNGTPVQAAPQGCEAKPWWEAGQVIRLRFDPNENWTGNIVPAMTFHQEIDWIRLTKVDRAARGSIFPIQITLNKPVDQLQSINFYYTTDRRSPRQHSVKLVSSTGSLPDGPLIFLPLVTRLSSEAPANGNTFSWDTSGVAPGQYYICAEVNDGYNETISCSTAPVEIYQ
ncbi:MAG: hypothetical protein GX495_04800 [Chloroflexi bacterium]|jgi:hypothetical protein|nr:hypothetical protein [Chloroflexota bacterium]